MIKHLAVIVGALGWAAWAASLAAPVARLEKGQFLGLASAPEIVVRGWEVLRGAVYGVPGLWRDPGDSFVVLLGLGSAVVIASPYALFARHTRFRRVLSLVAGLEALGLATVYVASEGWSWAGSGYWLWLSSFLLVSASLAMARPIEREFVNEPAG